MNLNEQVLELKNDWEMNERWAYVKRPYSAEEVVKLRGSLQPECTLARKGAEKLWNYLFTCLLYTSPSPRDRISSRMPSSA